MIGSDRAPGIRAGEAFAAGRARLLRSCLRAPGQPLSPPDVGGAECVQRWENGTVAKLAMDYTSLNCPISWESDVPWDSDAPPGSQPTTCDAFSCPLVSHRWGALQHENRLT
jgi:hypothetical protein